MSYLDKYKVGSTTFRTLSEARMQLRILRNTIRYSETAPTSIAKTHDLVAASDYDKVGSALTFELPESTVVPESCRPLLERENPIEFPETFVLRVPKGRVLGDGTVLVDDGTTILSESTTDFHRKQEHHRLLSERHIPKPESFDGRLAAIASPGSDNYFHWTLDSVPRLSLLNGLEDQIDAYYVDTRNLFHREWIDLLGIPKEKIIETAPERHIAATELIVPSFAGRAGLPSPAGLDFIRSFMPPVKTEGRKLYISRAAARRRRVLNENELLPLLEKHAFETVHPGKMTVKEQMETFASASVVVAPHGAELTNLAYCRAGTRVIELLSPYYLNPCFKQLAAVRSLHYTALVGQGGKRTLRKQRDAHHVWTNLRVDPILLNKALSSIHE